MTARDRFWISLHHMKSGIVGVLLVVIATAIGITLASSTGAFIQAYRIQTSRLLNHPVYREVLVEVPSFGETTEIKTPVVEIELKEKSSYALSMDDMRAAAEAAPAVAYAYPLERDEVTTTGALMRTVKESGRGGKENAEKMDEIGKTLAMDETLAVLPIESFAGVRTTSGFFTAYGLSAVDGFLFSQEDIDAGNLIIILGGELAKTLFPSGGAVGSRISLNFQTFTVGGVLGATPYSDPKDLRPYNAMAFMPQENLEKVWNKRVPITSIRFATRNSADTRAAVSQLTAYFGGAHPDIHVMITNPLTELKNERQTFRTVIAVLVFLSGAGLFIASINLLNLMLVRVIKHTKGIGIMRALGFSRMDVFRQFFAESILMCTVGAIIGLVSSPVVFGLLQKTVSSRLEISSDTLWFDLLIGALFGFFVGIIFGFYPAFVAKNTDATLAIRTE